MLYLNINLSKKCLIDFAKESAMVEASFQKSEMVYPSIEYADEFHLMAYCAFLGLIPAFSLDVFFIMHIS